MELLPNRANEPSAPQTRNPRRLSLFGKVVATIILAILIGGAVAAIVVGLLTFAIVLLLVVPILVLLLVIAIIAGRVKLTISVQRGDSAGVSRSTNQSPHQR